MFHENNPDIQVDAETVGRGDYWTKLATQAAGGNMPDVVQMDYRYQTEYARRGQLAVLDNMVGSAFDLAGFEGTFLDSGRVDGKLYAVPWGGNSMACYYNVPKLAEAGVEMPDHTWTWEDFAQIAKDVKAADKGYFGVADKGHWEGGLDGRLLLQAGAFDFFRTGPLAFRSGARQLRRGLDSPSRQLLDLLLEQLRHRSLVGRRQSDRLLAHRFGLCPPGVPLQVVLVRADARNPDAALSRDPGAAIYPVLEDRLGEQHPAVGGAQISGVRCLFHLLDGAVFRGIPRELDEAARMDGCGPWRIDWRIMLPLSTPVLATAAIFSFIWTWDDFLGPLIYLNDIADYTVPLGLRAFVDSTGLSAWGQLFAMSSLSLLPVFLFFVFFQRLIIRGVATPAMKR